MAEIAQTLTVEELVEVINKAMSAPYTIGRPKRVYPEGGCVDGNIVIFPDGRGHLDLHLIAESGVHPSLFESLGNSYGAFLFTEEGKWLDFRRFWFVESESDPNWHGITAEFSSQLPDGLRIYHCRIDHKGHASVGSGIINPV